LVPATVAQTLGLTEATEQPIEGALLDHLSDKRILLVLDNFEQVLDAAPAIVQVLQASRWLKIIVTSREALHVRGERRHPIPPLKAPRSGQTLHVEQSADYASVKLFVERAQTVKPDFILDESNAGAVGEICRRLGGLPLAIELIAARIRLFSPTALLARLGQGGDLELLTEGARDLPARHRSLRGAIAWSYNLLTEAEQAQFRRMGVFVGGFTPESATAVCEGAGDQEIDPLEGMASLLDKSLLSTAEERAPDLLEEPRFFMLEMIHEFALHRLEEEGETEETQRRHAIYFLELAERVQPELMGPNQTVWLARLEREYSNIRAALEWSSDHEPEITVRLMSSLARFWYIRGHYAEGGNWLERVLAMGDRVPDVARASALLNASAFVYQRGDIARGISYLEKSVALARHAGDMALVSQAQGQLGYILLERGEIARAKALFENCLALDREMGDKYGICWLMTALGEVARSEEEYEQARAYYEEGLLLAREMESKYNIAHLAGNLGWVALAEGDCERARSLFRESLILTQELEFGLGIAGCLARFAALAAALPQPERAARLSGAVERLLESLGTQIDSADRKVYERYLASARVQLGEEAWKVAWSEGQIMGVAEAVAYALSV
jgi:predicted ATPase